MRILLQNAKREALAFSFLLASFVEACQRSVAEHRLELALSARDAQEIERSMRQVRALGHVGLGERRVGPRGSRPAGGLVEEALSVLNGLNEAAARRQAAAAALLREAPGTAAIQEAKQSRVAPSLVEQARVRLRLKRRQRRGAQEALAPELKGRHEMGRL